MPNQKPFSVNTVSVNNADTQVAKYNIPSLEPIQSKDSQQKAKKQINEDVMLAKLSQAQNRLHNAKQQILKKDIYLYTW